MATFLVRGMARLETLSGNQTFTWKSSEVPCVPSDARVGITLSQGGFERTVELSLIVRRNEFLSIDTTLITIDSDLWTADSDKPHPVAGRKLIFRGKTYRIVQARESAARSHYVLDLTDANAK